MCTSRTDWVHAVEDTRITDAADAVEHELLRDFAFGLAAINPWRAVASTFLGGAIPFSQ